MILCALRIVIRVTLAASLVIALSGCSDVGEEMATAAAAGNMAAVRELAAQHPDSVNVVVYMNDIGRRSSVLAVAVCNRQYAIASYLISKGARLEMRDSWLGTPLQAAISNDDPKMTLLLLRAGAQPNARDTQGQTVLHWAANAGDMALVKLLLAYGANPRLTDKSSKIPTYYALKSGHIDVARLLQRHVTYKH